MPSKANATQESTPALASVVIPAYQCADHIADALESVLSQTFSDYEILVVNDGSPDTDALERSLLAYESKIRYFKQENRGPSGARNLAMANARGQYVAFLDSDDTWLPHHLAEQIDMLRRNPDIDLVYADSTLVRDGVTVGHAFGSEPQHPPVTFEKILSEECTVGTSSTVARRQALIDAGLFDERFRCCEDFDLWLRMAFLGCHMDYHSGVHVIHRLSPDSLSGDRYVMKRARIEAYQKALSTLPISSAQRELIERLIAKNEAECQTDLAKQFLHSGEYAKALEAAQRASSAKKNWKMRAAVFGIRRAPRAFRIYHAAYQQLLLALHRIRVAMPMKLGRAL